MPKVSFYEGHAVKIIADVLPGALKADESLAKLAWLNYCVKCHSRATEPLPCRSCSACGGVAQPCGPLWTGKTSDEEFISKMIALNKARDYAEKKRVGAFLAKLLAENALPPLFIDLHQVADELGVNAPKTETVLQQLRKKGFAAVAALLPHGHSHDAGWKEVAGCQ